MMPKRKWITKCVLSLQFFLAVVVWQDLNPPAKKKMPGNCPKIPGNSPRGEGGLGSRKKELSVKRFPEMLHLTKLQPNFASNVQMTSLKGCERTAEDKEEEQKR